MIIGITGRVGVGKSTAAAHLASVFDATLIDLDVVGHDILKVPPVIRILTRFFGNEVVDESGEVDRKRLGSMVFSSPAQLDLLNQIVHPEIRDRVIQYLEWLPNNPRVIIVGALIDQIGLRTTCDKMLVIIAAPEAVAKAVGSKAKIGEVQADESEYKKDADSVVINTYDDRFLAECEKAVKQWII